MENELVKQLCSKQGFEHAAFSIINNPDIETFQALIEKFGYLFDFVKQNVLKRLQNCINDKNHKNLLSFLSVYSADFEDLIISNLKKYQDDYVKNFMAEKLKNGTDDEKTYCVKFFEGNKKYIEKIRTLSNSDFEPLAYNCALFMGKINDKVSFDEAIENLKDSDDFKVLKAAKFLCAYNDKKAIPDLFKAMQNSSMAENIAVEILYLEDIFSLLKNYPKETLLLINNIINTLGEVVPLSVVFDIQLYDIIEHLNSPVTLLCIKQKIEQLTENDEYLFDEDKSVKDEIYAIKDFLNSKGEGYWDNLCDELELDNNLIYYTLNIIQELNLDYSDEIKELIEKINNETLILKSTETMKIIGKLEKLKFNDVISKIKDKNIKEIIKSYFEN